MKIEQKASLAIDKKKFQNKYKSQRFAILIPLKKAFM